MKTQIRKAVFETNSSSSHSLTLSKGDVQMRTFSPETVKAGRFAVGCDEYGWNWERFYKPENKLWYLVTAATGGCIDAHGSPEEVTAELRETNSKIDQICRVVEQHTGVELVMIPGSEGYIDHESVGEDSKVYESDEVLRQFLFGTDAFVETGNDNSGPPEKIHTDLGTADDYYVAFRAEVPAKGYVPVTLSFRRGSLVTAFEVELHDKPILAKIQETGVATKVVLSVHPDYSFYGENPEGRVMSDLSDMGIRFTQDLKVTVTRKKSASSFSSDLDIEVMLHKAVAKELGELA
jgi:hypothetical protein